MKQQGDKTTLVASSSSVVTQDKYKRGAIVRQNKSITCEDESIRLLNSVLEIPLGESRSIVAKENASSPKTQSTNTTTTNNLAVTATSVENAIKRNDKHTIKKFLHSPLGKRLVQLRHQSKQQQQANASNKETTSIPVIFDTIVHACIEANAIDVLRTCLETGMDANFNRVAIEANENDDTMTMNEDELGIHCSYCARRQKERRWQRRQHRKSSQNTAVAIDYASYAYLSRLPPLFLAVSRCRHECVELLLQYDACTNVQDEMGNGPLHLALGQLTHQRPCQTCLVLLLKNHASSRLVTTASSPTRRIASENNNNNNKNNQNQNQSGNESILTIQSQLVGEIFAELVATCAEMCTKWQTIASEREPQNVQNETPRLNTLSLLKRDLFASFRSLTAIGMETFHGPYTLIDVPKVVSTTPTTASAAEAATTSITIHKQLVKRIVSSFDDATSSSSAVVGCGSGDLDASGGLRVKRETASRKLARTFLNTAFGKRVAIKVLLNANNFADCPSGEVSKGSNQRKTPAKRAVNMAAALLGRRLISTQMRSNSLADVMRPATTAVSAATSKNATTSVAGYNSLLGVSTATKSNWSPTFSRVHPNESLAHNQSPTEKRDGPTQLFGNTLMPTPFSSYKHSFHSDSNTSETRRCNQPTPSPTTCDKKKQTHTRRFRTVSSSSAVSAAAIETSTAHQSLAKESSSFGPVHSANKALRDKPARDLSAYVSKFSLFKAKEVR